MNLNEMIGQLLALKKLLESRDRDCDNVYVLYKVRLHSAGSVHVNTVELVDYSEGQDNLDVELR